MTPSRIFIALSFLVLACSTKPNLNHPAITGVPTPVYDGMISALSGSKLVMLPPQKVVYLTSASMTANGLKFVEVSWNDSTGYVPEGWILPNGKPAVLNGALTAPVTIYKDAGLKIPSGDVLDSWATVSMGRSGTLAKEIMYAHGDNAAIGFIPAAEASADTLDIAFYHAYENVGGDVNKMNALAKDERFATRPAFQKMFKGGVRDTRLTESTGAKAQRHTAIRWENRDGTPMAKEDYPGEFSLYFIFQDGSESQINHLGDTLENGYPGCLPIGQQSVSKYKLVFKPAIDIDFTFSVLVDLPAVFYTERSGPFEKSFEGCKAGQEYVFIVEYPNVSYVTCGDAKISIRSDAGHYGEGMIYASCGD